MVLAPVTVSLARLRHSKRSKIYRAWGEGHAFPPATLFFTLETNMHNYWHSFRAGRKAKKDVKVQGIGGLPAERGPVAASDNKTVDVIVGGLGEAPETPAVPPTPPARPQTYEEKALELNHFDIEGESEQLADYVTYYFSHQILLTKAQQRNMFLHFRDVLRRCAMVHMNLPDDIGEP
jgi:hypothetical protein